MRILIAMLAVLPALSGGVSAHAQLYKWVDERGVVNYSNQLPVNPADAKKLAVVEDRVSVYTPDPALLGAMEAERQGRGVTARMAELERSFDSERRARQVAAAAVPLPPGPCSIWPADCLGLRETYYAPAFVTVVPRFPLRHRSGVWPNPARIANLPGYLRAGRNPASRHESVPSRDRGRNSMHPEPKP